MEHEDLPPEHEDELRKQLDGTLAQLDALPRGDFAGRAPLLARAEELRSTLRHLTEQQGARYDASHLSELRQRSVALRRQLEELTGQLLTGVTMTGSTEGGGPDPVPAAVLNAHMREGLGLARLQRDLSQLESRITAAENAVADAAGDPAG